MESYLYLTLNLASILMPALFSFYPKAHFASRWRAWLPAILLPAIIFIIWDEWFTSMGVWGFNPRYLTGITIGHLPLEEILFFICIPYACLFTYSAVNYFRKTEPLPDGGKRVTWILIVGLTTIGLRDYDHWYTAVTFISLSIFLLALITLVKPNYLGRFYFSYLFILIPFFIVNGILTGSMIDQPVVWYNDAENLRIRLGTIPFEDTFYGMLLILMNVAIYEYKMKQSHQR